MMVHALPISEIVTNSSNLSTTQTHSQSWLSCFCTLLCPSASPCQLDSHKPYIFMSTIIISSHPPSLYKQTKTATNKLNLLVISFTILRASRDNWVNFSPYSRTLKESCFRVRNSNTFTSFIY